ncbi:hypothetical protein BDP27DRAFT_1423314 [Rhodocollybia butyracea]|uniref:Uncharacterized protein n=1 Tax=Rhodocollybia butyracea TaxID=206335 RepID=A0A9P5PNA3_9AGAR|nr:hypothetical protein BDP27DRAFT_1434404 [Rhodocollybia butyracea]KAF9067028.1 hypothetical protein BDP27DRAFT_1423314 [Rhodocollybia butyracea]
MLTSLRGAITPLHRRPGQAHPGDAFFEIEMSRTQGLDGPPFMHMRKGLWVFTASELAGRRRGLSSLALGFSYVLAGLTTTVSPQAILFYGILLRPPSLPCLPVSFPDRSKCLRIPRGCVVQLNVILVLSFTTSTSHGSPSFKVPQTTYEMSSIWVVSLSLHRKASAAFPVDELWQTDAANGVGKNSSRYSTR